MSLEQFFTLSVQRLEGRPISGNESSCGQSEICKYCKDGRRSRIFSGIFFRVFHNQ